jgi:hypothetical protein
MIAEPIALTSPRWRELEQAHGSAEDIARLLVALYETEDDASRTELWYGAWATLCPGERVFSASYACAPHLLRIVEARDFAERVAALHLVTQIEISRHAPGAPAIDDDLVIPYAAAIESLPRRVAELQRNAWDPSSAQVLAAALLAGKRHHGLAHALLGHVSDGQ